MNTSFTPSHRLRGENFGAIEVSSAPRSLPLCFHFICAIVLGSAQSVRPPSSGPPASFLMTFQWWFKSSRLQLLSVTRKQKTKQKKKNPPSKDRLSLLRGSAMSGAVPSLHYGTGLKRGQQEERTYTFLHRSWINEQYRKRGEGYSCGTNFGTRNKGLLTFFQGQTASPDSERLYIRGGKNNNKCSAFESFIHAEWNQHFSTDNERKFQLRTFLVSLVR